MLVYLVRHGDAVLEAAALSDESRYLSAEGRGEARGIGATLASMGVIPETILSSPLVRAVQTAELIAAACAPDRLVAVLEELAPSGSVRAAAARLAAYSNVLAVGHEPSISGLAAALTGRNDFPAFRKGQVVLIEQGAPRWLLLPGDAQPRAC